MQISLSGAFSKSAPHRAKSVLHREPKIYQPKHFFSRAVRHPTSMLGTHLKTPKPSSGISTTLVTLTVPTPRR